VLAAATALAPLYLVVPRGPWLLVEGVAAAVSLGGLVAYRLHRPAAARLIFY